MLTRSKKLSPRRQNEGSVGKNFLGAVKSSSGMKNLVEKNGEKNDASSCPQRKAGRSWMNKPRAHASMEMKIERYKLKQIKSRGHRKESRGRRHQNLSKQKRSSMRIQHAKKIRSHKQPTKNYLPKKKNCHGNNHHTTPFSYPMSRQIKKV